MNTGLKLVAFLSVTALATALVGALLSGAAVTGPVTGYRAVLSDAGNLGPGDRVRVAGIDVGSVQDLAARPDNSVLVEFTALSSFPLMVGTRAAVRYKNLVGDRYLELAQGVGPDERLPAGGTIPLAQTTPAVDLDTLFDGFKPLLAALSPDQLNAVSGELVAVLQGQGGTVEALLGSIASVTATLADRDQVIGRVIDNLNSVLGTVHQRDGELSQLIVDLQRLVGGLDAQRDQIGAALSHVDEASARTAELLAQTRPALRADIDQLGRLATGLNANRDTLNSVLAQLPEAYRDLARTGAWGSFFNVYLCGLRIKLGDSLYTPMISSGVPRCQPTR
ncbi:MCE family protein [Kutzneria albida]|uniref:Uncharacterized protein n=1 Tax=Kutzneria albida DSM 43870 TaxID=1449976 RepID=W5WKH5_9PSEU|nr:MCE family protein [Kutzneria albida]AHI01072.1 hypothetical protein KALB_7714 [Kutzneria albida DSM 43870]